MGKVLSISESASVHSSAISKSASVHSSAVLNPLSALSYRKDENSLDEIISLVAMAEYSFGFKLYMEKGTLARHTGILCFLDDECSFTLDFGDNGRGFKRVHGSLDPSKYKLSGPFILRMDIDSDSDKQTIKDILREWFNFNMGPYNLLLNNCRHFCKRCMEIAERYRSLNRRGKTEANYLLTGVTIQDIGMGAPLALPLQPFFTGSRMASENSN